MPDIRPARAKRFTLQLRDTRGAPAHKIAKLFWGSKDGSLFVSFPYFENSEGLVCIATIQPGPLPQDVSLEERGKITSHLVKYSHHRDGRAHFSQDGKVLTSIKKRSGPLNVYSGHLFTIQLQGLKGFEASSGRDHDLANQKDQPITFTIPTVRPHALKIIGHWYTRRELNRWVGKGPVGPGTTLKINKTSRNGVLVSAPWGTPGSGAYLFLFAELIPPINSAPYSQLTFLGGFDPPEITNDTARATQFLALSYPATDSQRLHEQLGTIDLPRG